MSTRLLLRTDGGGGIGLGHLNRCISLATALTRSGATTFFAVHGDDAAATRPAEAGYGTERVLDPLDADETIARARRLECRGVVVDSYLVDGAYLQQLRAAGLFVVAIDDLNEHEFACQMVVSQSPHAPEAGYRSSSGDTRFLLGPQYTILRPEFWDSPLPIVKSRTNNVLITSGGADPDGCLSSWLSTVDTIDERFSVTAIIGPFFADPSAVHDAAAACERVVRVIEAPPVIRPMLAAADVALIAGGQTIYEAGALGIPAVAVEIASNQRPQMDAFARAGAVLDAGASNDPATASRIVQMLGGLIVSQQERQRLSDAAKSLVNRKGAILVAQEILRNIATKETL